MFFFLNFYHSLSWLIELKAPLKSMNRHHCSLWLLHFFNFSNILIRFWTIIFILISVPRPLLNPVYNLAFLAPSVAVAASILCFSVWSICLVRGGYIVIGLLFLKLGGSAGSFRICTYLTMVYFSYRFVFPVSTASQYFCRLLATFCLNSMRAFFMYCASTLWVGFGTAELLNSYWYSSDSYISRI